MSDRAIYKIVYLGKDAEGSPAFARVKYNAGRLAITGVVNPKRNGDCEMFGACVPHMRIEAVADNLKRAHVESLQFIASRWHMNDLRAGSPAQEAYIREHMHGYPGYEKVSAALGTAGLNPDTSFLHDGKPYKYGSAWLKEDVPEHILDWLERLPPPLRTPAWI